VVAERKKAAGMSHLLSSVPEEYAGTRGKPWGRLKSIGKQNAGSHELHATTVSIGRRRECTVEIPPSSEHAVISGHHCTITLNPTTGEVMIEDLSSNGTFVNLKRLEQGKCMPLRPKDRIGFSEPIGDPSAEGAPPLPAYAFAFEDLLIGDRPWLPPCRELITSERTYLECLEKMVTSYLRPLRQWAQEQATDSVAAAAERKGVVTVQELGEVFGNVEALLTINGDLYTDLHGVRGREPDPRLQARVLAVWAHGPGRYYEPHVKGFHDAHAKLTQLLTKRPLFAAAVRVLELQPQMKGLRLQQLLITTVHPLMASLMAC
jgi:hypothetical protein